MTPDELFHRNGIVSRDGKVACVLTPPTQFDKMQSQLERIITDAERRGILLRVGMTHPPHLPRPVLVFAIDLESDEDDYHFLRRLAQAFTAGGVRPLDENLGPDVVFDLASDLLAAERPD